MTLHVACAADAAYLPHCAAMLHSLLDRHPDAHVHFLHDPEMPAGTLAPLARMVAGQGGEFHPHRIPPEWVSGLPRLRAIPPLMWYRIYLPDLLPDLDRVLYLDCDMLVVDDLAPLWRTPLEGWYVAAVSNVLERDARDWPQRLGMARPEDYFNSGLLLLNLAALRRDGMAARLAAFGRAPGRRLKWPDQDALNALLGERRLPLHPRWNCQNSLFYYPDARRTFGAEAVAEAVRDPAILHFEGGGIVKPWHYLSRHPYRARYLEHRRATPWPEMTPEGRTAFHRLLRPLPTPWTIAILRARHRLRRRLRSLRGDRDER